jgi:hypothetical protein
MNFFGQEATYTCIIGKWIVYMLAFSYSSAEFQKDKKLLTVSFWLPCITEV